jgi:integrase
MGLYRRKGSRFWWMSYLADRVRHFESTKTTSKEIATRIWKKREGEIALGLFKVGWPGERMTFAELCEEFLRSHTSTLSTSTERNHQLFARNMRTFWGQHKLTEIDQRMIEEYRDYRRRQPSKRTPNRTVKGATVNRELECLQCMFEFAVDRKYIAGNPAARVKHFDERRERPGKGMLTVEQEQRILEAAPPYLRVGIVLLVQTGGRTYSEGFSLRKEQVDLQNGVIYPEGNVKTEGSSEPIPLSKLACNVLRAWVKEQGDSSPFLFPSPVLPDRPISTVKRAWRATLKRAGVSPFPIYNLRHVFCTRLSWVAPDAVVQRAMRHSSPETKRRYQLGLAEQVREHIEKANKKAYQGRNVLHFRDSNLPKDNDQIAEVL